MMNNLPKYISGLITEDERLQIIDSLNKTLAAMPSDPVFDETNNDTNIPSNIPYGKILNTQMGKVYFNLSKTFFSKDILDKLTACANNIEPGTILHSITYTEYSKKYGKPKLGYHMDRFDHFLLIDLQIDSNTEWKLGADGTDYDMKNGDALALHAGSTIHGRPHKDFNDGDFVSMIFLDFMRPAMQEVNND